MSLKKNYIVAIVRWLMLIIWLTVLPSLFFTAKILKIEGRKKLPHIFHHGLCFILGLKREFSGQLHLGRPCLYVSNHISYIDIFVLGGLPAYFIAKSEVANWPVLGPLSKFQNTLFIERSAGKARSQLELLKQHLSQGNSLTLFPEGTSTNGAHVKPFKSSLFEAANLCTSGEDGRSVKVAIQPITVAYTHYNNEKIRDQLVRDNYAWYAKMPFAAHFFNLFTLKKAGVKIHYHPVCYLDDFESRKYCADHCQSIVESKLEEFIK